MIGLSPWLRAAAQGLSDTRTGAAPVLSGTNIDLVVGESPVNFTGKPRMATTINGSIPAPTLKLREGDTVTIRVTNRLRDEAEGIGEEERRRDQESSKAQGSRRHHTHDPRRRSKSCCDTLRRSRDREYRRTSDEDDHDDVEPFRERMCEKAERDLEQRQHVAFVGRYDLAIEGRDHLREHVGFVLLRSQLCPVLLRIVALGPRG